MASVLTSISIPSAGLFRPGASSTKPRPRRATLLRVAADGAAVEAATDGKHEAAAMSALDNCVTSSSLSFGDKYEVGKIMARPPHTTSVP